MLERSQQVFDDCIAAVQLPIAQRYTSCASFDISRGCNGSLPVAACMTQRPDHFGAVIRRVPVLDIPCYHRWEAALPNRSVWQCRS
jgi:prolyl oligopeptidase